MFIWFLRFLFIKIKNTATREELCELYDPAIRHVITLLLHSLPEKEANKKINMCTENMWQKSVYLYLYVPPTPM